MVNTDSTSQAPMVKRLEGKVAIITGAANGIGRSTAKLFAQHGAKVIIADIDDANGHAVAKEIGLDHAIFIHCDVRIESNVQKTVDATIEKHGKLDITFSNAGIAGDDPENSILEVDYDRIKQVFDVNVLGSFYCAKHAAQVMIPTKKGSIIFSASAATVVNGSIPHTCTSSKNAILGLAKNIGVELGQYGIKVNCVSPYLIATKLGLSLLPTNDRRKAEEVTYKAANLKGHVLREEDVAEAALYLASEESKYISGLNLVIDGGFNTTNVALDLAVKKVLPSA